MNQAIQKLITSLRDKPDDSLLLDRIVTLLSMEPDSNDKVVMAMELVRALEISKPKVALLFAKAVFEHQPRNLECLELIAEIFVRLGRHAKAEVIRSEAAKLKIIIQKKISVHPTAIQGKFNLTAPPPPPSGKKEQPKRDLIEVEFAETVHSIVSEIQPVAEDLANEEQQVPEFSGENKKFIPDFSKVLRTSVAPMSVFQIRRAPKLARMAVFDPKE